MPTFTPGCTRVPRWRTRIWPALTRSPPKTFTPRRFAWESRPFLELPPAFLCAMLLTLNDVVDAQLGVGLPMPLRFLETLAAAKLEDLHLVAAAVAEHGGLDERAGDERRAHLDALAVADEEHLVERYGRADIGGERLDAKLGARLDAILLAAGFDHCVHRSNRGRGVNLGAALQKAENYTGNHDLPVHAGAGRGRHAAPRPLDWRAARVRCAAGTPGGAIHRRGGRQAPASRAPPPCLRGARLSRRGAPDTRRSGRVHPHGDPPARRRR